MLVTTYIELQTKNIRSRYENQNKGRIYLFYVYTKPEQFRFTTKIKFCPT